MATLHYTESGQGEPLILLHSGGMSGAEWTPQIPLFARHFRVVVPDHLGHGRSPMIAEKLIVGDMGRAVLELMDELALPWAHLVGSSLGGAVALWLAVHHPERVSKLVLYRVGYRKDENTHAGTRGMADPAYWRGVGMHKWLSDIHRPQGGPDAWEEVIGGCRRHWSRPPPTTRTIWRFWSAWHSRPCSWSATVIRWRRWSRFWKCSARFPIVGCG